MATYSLPDSLGADLLWGWDFKNAIQLLDTAVFDALFGGLDVDLVVCYTFY